MKYQGPQNADEIRNFIIAVHTKISSKQRFDDEEVKEDPRGGIPAYTIGHPLYGDDDVCYLEFVEAYKNGK
jgi:hypothetical protein